MTSNDLKMTSKVLKMTLKDKNDKLLSKHVKSKNILRGGDPNDDYPIFGKDLVKQVFFPING